MWRSEILSGAPCNRSQVGWCCSRLICGTAPSRSTTPSYARQSRSTLCRSPEAALSRLQARKHLTVLVVAHQQCETRNDAEPQTIRHAGLGIRLDFGIALAGDLFP